MNQNESEFLNRTPTNKIVLITGSSSGIGQSTAIAFAVAGYHVVATLRNKNKSHTLQELAKQFNVNLDIRMLDVCDDTSVNDCITSVLKDYGRIDVLVNNAGTGYRGTLEETPLEDIKHMMNVNYYSVVRVTKAVLPSMRELRTGHIITVSSLGGLIALPFCDAYCAAKFAVEGLMESLAPVAASFGVNISLIEPGPVKTNFLVNVEGSKSLPNSGSPYADLELAYIRSVPERFSTTGQTPDEIAKVIVDASMASQPHLRYPTSQNAMKLSSRKLVDVTGDSIVQATKQMLVTTSTV